MTSLPAAKTMDRLTTVSPSPTPPLPLSPLRRTPPVSSKGERESERERERANGKGKGCEAIKEFKWRGGRDVEPYLYVDHNERRWDQ